MDKDDILTFNQAIMDSVESMNNDPDMVNIDDYTTIAHNCLDAIIWIAAKQNGLFD